MGEVAVQLSPEHVFPSGVDLERGNTIGVGEKIFVIGGTDSGKTSNDVQIFYESSGKWVTPTVMGTGPINLKNQHAVVLSKERILILQPNDVTWFLEVDTQFVREQKKKLNVEVVAWSKGVIGDLPRPIVISGPSGVGKGTLITKLMKEFPSTFGFSVSHTTRNPREKEQNGVHYHFTERRVMEKDISQGKFLESANVHGNLYGTSIEAVEVVSDAGKRCILDIDVQGAKSVRASSLDALFLFIRPPSFEELENRLRNRGTETEEQIQKRLTNARGELEQGLSSGIFDHMLVNSDLETCYQDLKKLLGLTDEVSQKTLPSMKSVVLPANFSVILGDKKVLIQSVNLDLGRNITYMLDLSSLKGGAPGRTKGLKFLESSAEEVQNGNATN